MNQKSESGGLGVGGPEDDQLTPIRIADADPVQKAEDGVTLILAYPAVV